VTRRGVVVVAAAVVALAATVGTSGFSTTVADRPVTIYVADDGNADLAVDVSFVSDEALRDEDAAANGTGATTDSGTDSETVTGSGSGTVAGTQTTTKSNSATTESTPTGSLAVTVKNQLPSGTSLTNVTVGYGERTRTLATATDPLHPGESTTVTFQNVTCGGTVVVDARGDSVTVLLERTVSCPDATDATD